MVFKYFNECYFLPLIETFPGLVGTLESNDTSTKLISASSKNIIEPSLVCWYDQVSSESTGLWPYTGCGKWHF